VIDLNGDGEITEEELAQCITTDDGGKLCPFDAAPCQARYTTPDCPNGYTYNAQTRTCQSNPTCEPGWTYDGVNKVCTRGVNCPSGGVAQNINGQWRCVVQGTPTCPPGFTYDRNRNVCVGNVSCPSGGVAQNINGQWRCVVQGTPTCPPGFTYDRNRNVCEQSHTAHCPSGGNIQYVNGQYICTVPVGAGNLHIINCVPRRRFLPLWGYDYYFSCLGNYNFSDRAIYEDLRPESHFHYYRYLGCRDVGSGVIYFIEVFLLMYDGFSHYERCEYYIYSSCPPGYTYNPQLRSCSSNVLCPPGSYYDPSRNVCVSNVNISCPSGYTYDPNSNLCVANITCPSGSTYNPNLQACVRPPSCIQGGAFNQNIGKCEGSASCPSGASLTNNGCFMGYFCPYGNYPCKPVNGVMMCSANRCLTASEIRTLEEDEPDEPSDYKDDGEMDSAGQCLGQIYIFNGEKQRCRPLGMKTGFQNCCSSKLAKKKIYDSTGSTGATFSLLKFGADAMRHAYDMVYLGYQFASGNTYIYFGQNALILSKSADFANPIIFNVGSKQWAAVGNMLNQMRIRPNAEGIFTVSGGDQAVANAMAGYAQAIGPAMALAITHLAISGLVKDPQLAAILNLAADGVFFYLFPGLVSPIGIALAVIAAVAGFFMSGGCNKEDIITVIKRESGRCHYVGSRCIKRLRLGFIKKCIQRGNFYCCFNSKLARIIHEQGRPQLNTDIKSWGSSRRPNCRGFTPEEFASLDFDRIDLSEYFEDITINISSNVDIQTRVQEYFYGTVRQRASR
jgi:conjugal transfer mating pair stabilization protein TraN